VAGGYMVLGSKMVPSPGDATATAAEPAAKATDTDLATASLTPAPADPAPETTATVEPSAAETVAAADTAATLPAEATAEIEAGEPAAETASEPAAETGSESGTPTIAPAPEPTEPVTDAPAETVEVAATEPVATETAPEPEAQPTEPAAAETVAAEVPATEAPATAEPVPEAPVVAAAAPATNQVAFAAWDVEMPFSFDDRMVNGKRVAVVTRFTPGIDAQRAGDWLAPGVTIYAVNGIPVDVSRSLTVAVMNAMAVDPDGKARVVVEYSDRSQKRMTGLLTVGAVRLVSLQNGVATRVSVVDGAWRTEVSGVAMPEQTTLQPGDVLFRDKTTSTALDGPDSLEKVLADLVAQGMTQTGFSVIRNNKVDEATMQLSLAKGD
jgi:hypothetical protein